MKNYLVVGARWSLRSTSVMRNYLPFQEAIRLAGGNTGNLLIGEAVHRHLMHLDHSSSVVFNRLPILLNMPQGQLSSVYDALVIASSNFINPKTELQPFAELIERLDIPVIVIGIGAELDDLGRMGKLSSGSERFLSLIKERCQLIGVRGESTSNYLASRGVTNTQVIGCPSYYLHGGNGPEFQRFTYESELPVAISITRDRTEYDSHKQLRELQKQLIRYVLSSDQHGYFVQTNFAEAWMSYSGKEREQHLKNMQDYFEVTIDELRRLMRKTRIHFNIDEWGDDIKNFGATIGTRFHGNLIALQQGIPAMWISHDYRTQEMCDFLGLQHCPIMEINKKKIGVADLLEQIDYRYFSEFYREKYKHFRLFMQKNDLPLKENWT